MTEWQRAMHLVPECERLGERLRRQAASNMDGGCHDAARPRLARVGCRVGLVVRLDTAPAATARACEVSSVLKGLDTLAVDRHSDPMQTTSTALLVTNPTTRAMSIARRQWDRANDAGEGLAGSAEIDALVCEHLGNGSDALLLVVQDGRTLACAYSYGASWCVDVTDALLDA